jgi:hypothetical protein
MPAAPIISTNTFRVAGKSFNLPSAYNGQKVLISLYSPRGSLLKRAMYTKRVVNIERDLALSPGVYVVRIDKRGTGDF